MDIRIGVTQALRELTVELADDTDPDELRQRVERALSGEDPVLWLSDRKGKRLAVPGAKLAYVELGTPDSDRRIGFGS